MPRLARSHSLSRLLAGAALCVALLAMLAAGAPAADLPPNVDEATVRAALRARGMSEEAIEQAIRNADDTGLPTAATPIPEPARRVLEEGAIDSETPAPPGRVGADAERARAEVDAKAAAGEGQPSADTPQADGADGATARPDTLPRFGHDLFNLPADTFSPPAFGPIDPGYRVGPGDELVVDVWGDVVYRLVKIVDREGGVLLPDVGKVSLSGQTLSQARERVRGRLSVVHSGLGADPPTAFVDVSLGKLRPVKVFVVGDVSRPGAYDLSAASTVFHALYYAGGPNRQGSLRDVRVVRDGRVIARLDVYDYLLRGVRTNDIRLQDDDTVFVPVVSRSVAVHGEVARPGIYEVLDSEGLAELVTMAGGVTGRTYLERVHVNRWIPPEERGDLRDTRIVLDVNLREAMRDHAPFRLHDLDDVEFLATVDARRNFVEVVGQVRMPGTYELTSGLRISGLIAQADSLEGRAFLDRAIIRRTREDETRETITVDLARALAGDPAHDRLLQPRDRITVYSRWEMEDRETVRISGAVRMPGEYELTDGMTLGQLLVEARGFREHAFRSSVEVSRVYPEAAEERQIADVFHVDVAPDFLETGELPDFPLKNHDLVLVRSEPFWELQRNVVVQGEVLFPGAYTLRSATETLTDVLERAGGLLDTAYPEGFRLQRPEGGVGRVSVDLAHALQHPRGEQDILLADGDVLTVPERPTTVKITGAVGLATSLVYRPGKGIGYYIDNAGGFLDVAKPRETTIVYSTGRAAKVRRLWFDPPVRPGSHIHVPERVAGEGTNWGGVIKDTTAILASLATTYLVIDRISQ